MWSEAPPSPGRPSTRLPVVLCGEGSGDRLDCDTLYPEKKLPRMNLNATLVLDFLRVEKDADLERHTIRAVNYIKRNNFTN